MNRSADSTLHISRSIYKTINNLQNIVIFTRCKRPGIYASYAQHSVALIPQKADRLYCFPSAVNHQSCIQLSVTVFTVKTILIEKPQSDISLQTIKNPDRFRISGSLQMLSFRKGSSTWYLYPEPAPSVLGDCGKYGNITTDWPLMVVSYS